MITAVITAKDEAATIGPLVHSLCALGYAVIVVDDGSQDDTGERAAENGAYVLAHDESQGIAKSLLRAWDVALSLHPDYIVQLDAGGSHDPQDAARLVEYAIAYHFDLVIGSRFCRGALYRGRAWRAIASRIAAMLMNFVAHARIKDWTSGYRVFSRKALETLVAHRYCTRMHAWQMEVLAWALLDGLKVAEAPIAYTAGRSSLRLSAVDEAISVFLWRFFC